MKLGLFLTNQNRLDKDMVAAFDEQVAMLHLARDHGWDSLFSGQHYLNEGDNQQLQLVPFLARLMADAGEMTCGLGILLINLHNPVYVAETVASLDVLARGNFVFGIGLGYRDVEFDAFAVPKGQRVRRFEDCLELVLRLWAGETVSFESDYCTLDQVRLNLRPVQRPGQGQRSRPPIWFAANNDRAVERAARLGDTWFVNPHATMRTTRRQLALYGAELKRLGKPFPSDLPVIKEVFCARNRAEALSQAGPYLGAKYQAYARWGQDAAMPADESLDQPFEALLQDRFVLGSPEECYQQLRPLWEELGCNHLVIRTHWSGLPLESALSSMRLISTELLPELRKL